ncbi:hypothetical protein D477_010526 [Arthrobacter crystallopoietes BAB-32]|uniref:DUF8129 domain-containing protein n=1 Tax=Arthrobacter crystallopoietes BAB-32 TaxID=1246476 RepID=N1UV48_9MICC|nr:hypothetical protein [Arthrobacter crystallopoietes]EMY34271.1 hypothetical protein D477_010526 [Arthrobacter crystallopoietes BAB-32]
MNESKAHNELPLPDYDHIPQGTLPTRITGLSEQQVAELLDYEKAHGNRLPVVQVLQQRIEALRNGAEPSGTANPDTPEVSQAHGGSPVRPETAGPPVNPPSQGVPTNPSQPR